MKRWMSITAIVILGLQAESSGAITTYLLNMTGPQEVGGGDPDGTAAGTLSLDDANGAISWNFSYANIVAPTDMHIHGPNGPAGVNAGVFVGLGVLTSGGAGTLVSSTSTSLPNIQSILANPANFYVNIHNGPFPSGAVRGQLGTLVPEPATLSAVVAGIMLWGAFRRR